MKLLSSLSLLALLPCIEVATAQTHTHGDAVGSLTPSSAVVWTRSSSAAWYTVRWARNANLSNANLATPLLLSGATDFCGSIQLRALLPDTRYWFATVLTDPFSALSTTGPTGSFRTPPARGTKVAFQFVVSGDINNHAQYDIFSQMASHAPAFFACLGDFPYADGSISVADFWVEHRTVRNEARLQAFLRQVPLIGTWDDHEVTNNWDSNTDPTKVQNGMAAWKHWFPLTPIPQEIYRSLRWGDALEYFILDTRSHRGINGAADLPGKRLLGAAQMRWLENALLASTATFKLIGTSVPLRFGTTGPDHWAGYMHSRRRLFDFIVTHEIDNVIFMSADQHWAASYHHKEGFRDFQTGPLATSTRAPQGTNDPQQRWVLRARNYGLVSIDPFAMPPTFTIDWIDQTGARLRREVIEAGPRATVTITADSPESRFELADGPFHANGSGQRQYFPYHEAGKYRVRFAPIEGAPGIPTGLDLAIPPGAHVHVAADYRDAEDSQSPVMFLDDFEGPLTGYTIVDEGLLGAPSAWFTDGGLLVQNSNIYTNAGQIDYPGTVASVGNSLWTDYTLRVRLKSIDNDGIGFVFRHHGSGDYYRFSMDSQRGFRRLVSRKNGAYRQLAADTISYSPYLWYDFEAIVIGNRIIIRQDGVTVFDVIDGDHPAGAIGLYSWGNMASQYDDLILRRGDARRSNSLFVDTFNDGVLTGWKIIDQVSGQTSSWTESGGTLNQNSNIYGGSMDAKLIPKPGTIAIAALVTSDCDITAQLFNGDDDGLGVVFRYVDANNYYRFSMDSQRTYRRLAKVVNGNWALLWQDLTQGYTQNQWHTVQVHCSGSSLGVTLDGQRLVEVTDSTFSSGRAGLYCWGSDQAQFDEFHIDSLVPERAVLATVTVGGKSRLHGRAPQSAGLPYLFALSLSKYPGVPLNLLFPSDPRTLELTPDALFFATINPPPGLFTDFVGIVDGLGNASASIAWPPIPGLIGLRLFTAGWTISGARMHELWPTAEIVVR